MKRFSTCCLMIVAVAFLASYSTSVCASDRGAINSGETKIGLSLTSPSYMDTWTFTGAEGDRVILSALTTAGDLDTCIVLYPPGGGASEADTCGPFGGGDLLDYQLKSTGLYTAMIRDFGLSATGIYNVSFLKIPGAVNSAGDTDGGPIASGETLSGTISVPSDMDAFQVYGNTGDRVILSALTTTGDLDTCVVLYPPGGGAAEAGTCGPFGGGDGLDYQLESTGLYTVMIRDFGWLATGTYNVSFLKIPGAVNSAGDTDGRPIASGETLNGTINVPSDMDAFQVYGNTGDRVILSALTTTGDLDTCIVLYPPGGGAAEAGTCGPFGGGDGLDYQLESTGLYTVMIRDFGWSATGTYNVSFLKIPGAVNSARDTDGGPIGSGESLSGTINVPSDMDAFQFYGNTGDRVILSALTTAGDLDTCIVLYPLGGGAAEADTCGPFGGGDLLDYQLKSTGLYTAMIRDFGWSATGTYTVSLTKIPSTTRPGIYNPLPANGTRLNNLTGTLNWDPLTGATGYDVYFGTSLVEPLTLFASNISSTSIAFPAIERGKTYYWHVVAHIPAARPICIDSHVLGGAPYYASVWIQDPATTWRAEHNQPPSEYQNTIDQLSTQGYRLIDVDTHVIGDIPYYTSIWLYNPNTPWQTKTGQTAEEYQSSFNQLSAQGYRLLDINTHVINNVPFYASIWIYDQSTPWAAFHGQTANDFQNTVNQGIANGYRLISIDTHVINSIPYYASIWIHDPNALWGASWGQTANDYQNTVDQAVANGYRLISVNTHVINNVPYYASVGIKDDIASWAARHGQPFSDYKQTFDQWAGYIEGPYWWFSTLKTQISGQVDYDGDGKTDISVWRPGDGNWYIRNSATGTITVHPWGLGSLNDWSVPGDYDGDGKTDYGIWRPGDGRWYILRSSDGAMTATQWGTGTLFAQSDVPVPGNYDGDTKTDIAVWRPGDGMWYILRSSDGGLTATQWGAGSLNDLPVPGDYDGDGKTDLAVWRPGDGNWYILRSSDGGVTATQWGTGTLFDKSDVPVPGDYDGDGKTDLAVWRPGDGMWYIFRSSDGGVTAIQWGTGTMFAKSDVPVPGDYDGDGKTDIAVWRPGDGMWYILRSSDGGVTATQWGSGDLNDWSLAGNTLIYRYVEGSLY